MQFLCEPVCDLYVRCLLTYQIINFRLTAYGKVFLVRKRGGNFSGNLYAMKVLKKATIVQKAKTAEHTRTERQVLEAVRRCPFLVTLHWAFQTESKLHLIMGMFKHFWCLVRHMEIQLTPQEGFSITLFHHNINKIIFVKLNTDFMPLSRLRGINLLSFPQAILHLCHLSFSRKICMIFFRSRNIMF